MSLQASISSSGLHSPMDLFSSFSFSSVRLKICPHEHDSLHQRLNQNEFVASVHQGQHHNGVEELVIKVIHSLHRVVYL